MNNLQQRSTLRITAEDLKDPNQTALNQALSRLGEQVASSQGALGPFKMHNEFTAPDGRISRTGGLTDDNQIVTYGDLKNATSSSSVATQTTQAVTYLAGSGAFGTSVNTGGVASALSNLNVVVVKEGDAGQPTVGTANLGQTSYSLIYTMYVPIDANRDHVEVWSQAWSTNTRPQVVGYPPADTGGTPYVDWSLEGSFYPSGYATYALSGNILVGTLSFDVHYAGTDTNFLFPTIGPFFIQIDSEYMLVSSVAVAGAVYTLTIPAGGRGAFGSTAAGHTAAAIVFPLYVLRSGWLALPNKIIYPVFDFAAVGFSTDKFGTSYSLTNAVYGNTTLTLVTIPVGAGGNYTGITTTYSTNGAATPKLIFQGGSVAIDNGTGAWSVVVNTSGVEISGAGGTQINMDVSGVINVVGSVVSSGTIDATGFKASGTPGINRGPENLVTSVTPATTSITYIDSIDFVAQTYTTQTTTVATGISSGATAHTFTDGLLTA
jgi:hypothetical protein